MIKVGVIGAAGRMGSEVCRAVEADTELELVARVDHDSPLELLEDAGAEVAVDFTTPAAVKANLLWLVDHGIHAVVGTTGLSEDDLTEIKERVDNCDTNVFVAPNFAVGAVLMMEFARQAAPYFDSAEIVERHHTKKLDAPSGTALRTAALMNDARKTPWEAPQNDVAVEGSRGGDLDGIRVHSLRVEGSVAHQEVLLGGHGETLTIRHDSLDRSSFMPGVILAIKRVGSLRGLSVGLENLLVL